MRVTILATYTVPGSNTEGLEGLKPVAGLERLFTSAEEPLGLEPPWLGPVLLTMVHGPMLHFYECLGHIVSIAGSLIPATLILTPSETKWPAISAPPAGTFRTSPDDTGGYRRSASLRIASMYFRLFTLLMLISLASLNADLTSCLSFSIISG